MGFVKRFKKILKSMKQKKTFKNHITPAHTSYSHSFQEILKTVYSLNPTSFVKEDLVFLQVEGQKFRYLKIVFLWEHNKKKMIKFAKKEYVKQDEFKLTVCWFSIFVRTTKLNLHYYNYTSTLRRSVFFR